MSDGILEILCAGVSSTLGTGAQGTHSMTAVTVDTVELLPGFFASNSFLIDERHAVVLIRVDLDTS
jgi:hypothetical protein